MREEVWNRVMRHEFRGKTVVLKLKFDNFRQITRSKTLFTPVDSAETLRRVSEELLAAADFHGRKIRLIALRSATRRRPARSACSCGSTSGTRNRKGARHHRKRYGLCKAPVQKGSQ